MKMNHGNHHHCHHQIQLYWIKVDYSNLLLGLILCDLVIDDDAIITFNELFIVNSNEEMLL